MNTPLLLGVAKDKVLHSYTALFIYCHLYYVRNKTVRGVLV